MYLKALTIKGFKSFADPATLELEPGITVVVGPNGSGKSNVVDAMGWVLGAQAPSAVRSQKMDDVIFAGTASRKPLGRAEVSLTIDNTDGQLPIEFNEVTITRTLFRSGDSDYAINGVSCRLLDIQELLSDSGVGRQQHIIISQGRIDDVLNAKPEERRGIIEEAAGVLKYRRRKERAERRLVATEENLHRLQDLLREVRRQVRPLEKQAEAARRHGSLVSELTTLKVHLAGRELRSLGSQLETAIRQRRELNEREREITSQLAALDAAVLSDEAALAALGASDVAEVASRARSLRERMRGQANVIAERRRRLERELQAAVDDGLVANLESEAAKLVTELKAAEAEGRRLQPEFERLAQAEARLSTEQLTFDTEWGDELAPKPTRAPEMRAQLKALEQAGQRSQNEINRLNQEIQAVEGRRARTQADATSAAETLSRLDTEQPELDRAASHAVDQRRRNEAAVTELTERRRQADAEAHRWAARRDALRQALDDARSRAGATALADQAGVLGVLLDLVAIDDGWDLAVEAAAGEALQAVVIDNPRNGAAALAALEANDLAGAVLALGRSARGTGGSYTAGANPAAGPAGSFAAGVNPAGPGAPAGTFGLRGKVRATRADVEELLDSLLGAAVVVDGSWRQAMEVALEHPELTVVTRQGDRFGRAGWRIGLSGTGATGAALEEAEGRSAFAKGEADQVAAQLQAAQAAAREAVGSSRSIEDRRRQAAATRDKAVALRDRSAAALGDFDTDRQRVEGRRRELAAQAQADEATAAKLRADLPAVENEEAEYLNRVEALSRSRTTLEERARAIAQTRRDLEVRAAAIEERKGQLERRGAETEARLERLVGEREQARVRREALEAAIVSVDGLSERLSGFQARTASWIEVLEAEHRAQSESAREVAAELSTRRNQRQAAEKELVEVRERRSRLELAETENRVKLESLTEALRRELDTEPSVAMATGQPEIEGEVSPEARVRDLERELKLLGPINPLALEEFEALKERHDFIDRQLDDVKTARRDLNQLIRSIDTEIVSVFSAAFADVSTNFVNLFSGLFPGGKGGLTLTNADDLLNCGVEVEAKPSGKNVKKLSLLSGGERSLVALAFLFAVFRSRPSPFYVMDEVEAALDDVNLSRFLALLEEFRKEAQLIVVSHQKRTMEAADVLYGVTMKPGGSSKVLSEKVEGRRVERQPVIDLRPAPMIVLSDDDDDGDDDDGTGAADGAASGQAVEPDQAEAG